MKPLRWWTASLVMFGVIATLAWDVFAFTAGGERATISAVFVDWIGQAGAATLPAFGFGFVTGGLFVHFFGWTMTKPETVRRR